nr:hypothetical protein [Desulfobulbaceae bacterium]
KKNNPQNLGVEENNLDDIDPPFNVENQVEDEVVGDSNKIHYVKMFRFHGKEIAMFPYSKPDK